MGLATAEALAREGANVSMFARRRDVLDREAERLGALAVRGDVTNPADLKRLVDRTVAAFGGIDILVNNSGGPPRGPAVGLTDDDVERAVELLLLSVVRLTGFAFLSSSGAATAGSSTSPRVASASPPTNLALSSSIRPGVIGWAKTMARELGPQKITVNSIAPAGSRRRGLMEVYAERSRASDMEQIPLRRFGRPEEVADVICFLAFRPRQLRDRRRHPG